MNSISLMISLFLQNVFFFEVHVDFHYHEDFPDDVNHERFDIMDLFNIPEFNTPHSEHTDVTPVQIFLSVLKYNVTHRHVFI